MNLISLALAVENLAQERPSLTVEPTRCLRSRNKAATCETCVTGCPVDAIHLEADGPQVDLETCIRCGLCLHLCPVGVFDGRDGVDRLLHCADQLVDREVVELACAVHPDLAEGDKGVDAVLRTTGCLASLGPSAYVGLASLGIEQIRVRFDACAECPLAALEPEIGQSLRDAQALLAAAGKPRMLTIAAQPVGKKVRPVYAAKNPPVSRRGFFQSLAASSNRSAEMMAPTDEPQTSTSPPRERRRLIRMLPRLDPPPMAVVPGGDVMQFAVSDSCTACAVCARACPTNALRVERAADTFAITFLASDCINCGLCLPLCEPGALTRSGSPTFRVLLEATPRLIHHGALRSCRKCHAPFAGDSSSGLCPICAFRQSHPFGAKPPGSSHTGV